VAARYTARPTGPFNTYNGSDLLQEESVELFNGWLVFQPMTDLRERGFIGNIQDILSIAMRYTGLGQAYPNMVECKLDDGFVIKPDKRA